MAWYPPGTRARRRSPDIPGSRRRPPKKNRDYSEIEPGGGGSSSSIEPNSPFWQVAWAWIVGKEASATRGVVVDTGASINLHGRAWLEALFSSWADGGFSPVFSLVIIIWWLWRGRKEYEPRSATTKANREGNESLPMTDTL